MKNMLISYNCSSIQIFLFFKGMKLGESQIQVEIGLDSGSDLYLYQIQILFFSKKWIDPSFLFGCAWMFHIYIVNICTILEGICYKSNNSCTTVAFSRMLVQVQVQVFGQLYWIWYGNQCWSGSGHILANHLTWVQCNPISKSWNRGSHYIALQNVL